MNSTTPFLRLEVLEVRVGALRPLGAQDRPSGIYKHPTSQPVHLELDGLRSDAQGDTRHHGGPEKALHHYPREHYDAWLQEDPSLAATLSPGAGFGENLSTLGVTEADVCIGDIFELGDTLLQLSQGRQPCWRLGARHNQRTLPRRLQQTRRTGWYYRVLRTGSFQQGQHLTLVERPQPEWTLTRVQEVLFGANALDPAELRAMASLPEISPGWRTLANTRISRQRVEDFEPRLRETGDAP